MNIEYKKVDGLIFDRLIDEYGEDLKAHIHDFHLRDDTFTLAAMDGDLPAGFVFVTPRDLFYPLEHLKEAYIEIIEVHENYRRQGIGQYMINCAEEWARKSGFKQIRTHSNNQAVEAINMWNKLNYGLCPHGYHDDEPKKDDGRGYWVAKFLNPKV